MGKLWIPAALIGVGIASLMVAPVAQSCVTWSDSRACETAGTIVLNVVGWALFVAGTLWFGLWWSRQRPSRPRLRCI